MVATPLRCGDGSQISKLTLDSSRTLIHLFIPMDALGGKACFSRFTSHIIIEGMAKTPALQWRRIPVSLVELCLDTTLRCGQSFRYVQQFYHPYLNPPTLLIDLDGRKPKMISGLAPFMGVYFPCIRTPLISTTSRFFLARPKSH